MAARARFHSPSTKAPRSKLRSLSKGTALIVVRASTQRYRPLTSRFPQTYQRGMLSSHGEWSRDLQSRKDHRLMNTRTWFNREQEFSMNCAAVTIGPPASSVAAPGVPYGKRPGPLVADIPDPNNGCETVRTTAEVKYPNPGPQIVPGDGVYPLAYPTPADKCGY